MEEKRLHTIEPAHLPNQQLVFLTDWLVTLKCNYDCSYCGKIGHDNTTQHPSSVKCLTMLRQMLDYANAVMEIKKDKIKTNIINLYGGEALYHPEIDYILEQSNELKKNYNFTNILRLTTNASILPSRWQNKITPYVDGITVSFHTEASEKMISYVKENILYLKETKKSYDVVGLANPRDWNRVIDFYEWCNENKINWRPKLLDNSYGVSKKFYYSTEKFNDLKRYFKNFELDHDPDKPLLNQGRGCCGGRKLCMNRNIKEQKDIVPNIDGGFKGWHCSAHLFFLFANGVTGEFFTNKDCRVTLDGKIGAIANIDTMDSYITNFKKLLKNDVIPLLKCVQSKCRCGTCAPKSVHKETLQEILKIFHK